MPRTYNRFTRDEDLRIAQLIAEGKTFKEIAAEHQVTRAVLNYRLERLRRSEGAVSTIHLVSMLIINGSISPSVRFGKS